MADRILRNRTQFTSTVKNELYKAIDNISSNTGIPKSKLLDRAIELLLEEMGYKITN